ncbi:hypothetical protein HU200_032044 [Digitaria exilis]|uniref:Xylanase inhibitor C-terminal domain-containing protein n=1 Tax=Digitaria exilis TaxID=1010633 RepID=A0A835BNJ7_9POAL|nr:hypothetical protein HU200_032044 [Digitaria exilis]
MVVVSPPGAIAGDGNTASKPIVTPISKDASLYTIPIKNGAPLVLDLAGPLVWSKCSPPPCKTSACAVTVETTLSANATDGKTPLYPVSFPANVACAPDTMLASLPSRAAGVAGLSRTRQCRCPPRSRPGSRCPSNSRSASPAMARPARPSSAAARSSSWLLRLSSSPRVSVPVPIPAGAFDLDARRGTGGVMLSTVTPYTTLRSDIYRALRDAFDAATSGIPRAAPVAPFTMCYEASAFGSTRLGPGVASIDLMLDGGRVWQLPGAKSLVEVNEQTLCFAVPRDGVGNGWLAGGHRWGLPDGGPPAAVRSGEGDVWDQWIASRIAHELWQLQLHHGKLVDESACAET